MIQKGAERLVLAATCLWMFAVMFDRLAVLREGAAIAAVVGMLLWAATTMPGKASAAAKKPGSGTVEGRGPQGWLLLPLGLWAAWAAASIGWSAVPAVSTQAWIDEVAMALIGFLACYRTASTSRVPKPRPKQLKAAGKAAEDLEADRPRYATFVEASCWIGTLVLAVAALTLRFHGIGSPADASPAVAAAPDRIAAWLAGCASFVGVVRQSSMLALIVLPVFIGMSARAATRHAGLSGAVLALLIGFASGSLLFWPLAAVVLAVGCWPVLRDKPSSAGAVVIGLAAALAFVVAAAIALVVTTYRDAGQSTDVRAPLGASLPASASVPALASEPASTSESASASASTSESASASASASEPASASASASVPTLASASAQAPASAAGTPDSAASWFKRVTDLSLWSQRLRSLQDGDVRPQLWSFYFAQAGTHPWTGVGFGKPLPALAYHPIAWTPPQGQAAQAGWPTPHARALWLNVLLQVGVIGLLLQCLAWAALTYAFMARAPGDRWLKAAGVALILGMIGRNLSDDLMVGSVTLAFWAHAGWLLGRARLSAIVRQRATSGRSVAMRRLRRVGN